MSLTQKGLILLILLLTCFSQRLFPQDKENEFRIVLRDLQIEFKGISSYDENQILSLIKSGSSAFLDLSEIDNDINRIKKFYFDAGFFDAVIDTSITVYYKAKEASVKFIINEKSQYKFNIISIKGLENLSSEIKGNVNDENKKLIKKGDRYNRNNISQEIFRIINVLNNNGYPDAIFEQPEIIKIVSADPALSKSIDVNITIKPNRRYYVNKISVQLKNNKHSISVSDFLKEVDIKENDLYNKDKIIEIENKINKISIVDYARIQAENIDSINNKIDLTLNVNLKDKYELKPEIFGYDINNAFYAGIGLSFSDRYFLGRGRNQTVGARILAHSIDINALELNFQLFQPNIFNNSNINGNWNLKGTFYSEDIFKIGVIKNNFQIVYDFPSYTYINNLLFDWKISNERFNTKSNILEYSNDTSIILTPDLFLNIFSSVFGLSVYHNSSNNFQFPTSGNIQTFVFEESGSIGTIIKKLFDISTLSYLKFTNIDKFYFNLSGTQSKSVLATKFLIGMIFEYGDNRLKINNVPVDVSIFPLEARYICGGSTSVRGWGARKLGTFVGKEIGGNFILEGSFEHRTRPFLESNSFFKDLGFVTFLDYGNLWKEPKYFKVSEIALAIGFGIRYYTIVGPVRFDFGFKLYDFSPGAGTDKWLFKNDLKTIFKDKLSFQFGIGNTF